MFVVIARRIILGATPHLIVRPICNVTVIRLLVTTEHGSIAQICADADVGTSKAKARIDGDWLVLCATHTITCSAVVSSWQSTKDICTSYLIAYSSQGLDQNGSRWDMRV